MVPNGNPRTLIGLAPSYNSGAIERASGQASKFALESLHCIPDKIKNVFNLNRTRDEPELIKIALTATEYLANFLRVTLSQSTGLKYRFLTVDAVQRAQSNTKELEKRLTSLEPLSEEAEAQTQRTATCFRDILSTVEELGQATRAKRSRARRGPQSSDILEPMFRSTNLFGSEAEKMFLLRLRHIYIRGRVLTATETLQELHHLYQEIPPDHLGLSEAMTDTAVRSLILILRKTIIQILQSSNSDFNFPPAVWELIELCSVTLNQPAHLQRKEETCESYQIYVGNRKAGLLILMREIKENFQRPPPRSPEPSVPAMEASPSVPPSALWQKLQSVESVAALTDGAESLECAICREETSCWLGDFGILSSCTHVFCVRCLSKWFRSNSTCPLCRAATSSWTTLKNFGDYKKRNEVLEDTERPNKRLRTE